ncbi:hypothetical protein, partial [Stenotrophomonas sp. MY18]|uniref:hypothetical protein n=1 Tax=Stenotrophomonas sp. MY18 TaxID=2662207 RepID=UPI0031B8A9F1
IFAPKFAPNFSQCAHLLLPALYFKSDIWLEVSMCGRFAQAQTREEYLAYLSDEADRDIAYDPEPIGRYNVAPGTKVLLLSERDEQ